MRFILLLICIPVAVFGQVVPPNNAEINYTHVMFEYPQVLDATYYVVDITEDLRDNNRGDDPQQISQTDSTTATLVTGLLFGRSYTWNVTAYGEDGEPILQSGDYHFTIQMSDYVKNFRFRLNRRYEGDTDDGVIFLDYCRVAVDRTGRPVWYFPRKDIVPDKVDIRNTELNPGGYLTLLPQPNGLVMSLDGRVLWRTPKDEVLSNTKFEFHHHEFIQLQNGNYMTLSKRYVDKPLFEGDSVYKVGYSTILEYTPDGELAWSWSAENYLMDEDLEKDKVLAKMTENETYGHANGIAFDEEAGIIFLSFRDLSCILKIDYHTGEVMEVYGHSLDSWGDAYAQDAFMRQHSPVLLNENELLFFNNNDTTQVSTINVMSVAEGSQGDMLWQFACNFDQIGTGNSFKMGSVQRMPNGNILVCMGYNPRIFEVTPDGDVVWDGVAEVREDDWKLKENYRISYAGSLYPTYFTVQRQSSGIVIYNEGSETDTYAIRVDGSLVTSYTVAPGERIEVDLDCTTSCEVIISSGNNRFYSRTVELGSGE